MNIDRRNFITRSLLAAPIFGAAVHAWLQCHRKPKPEGKWVGRVPFVLRFHSASLDRFHAIYPFYGRINNAPWHGERAGKWIIDGMEFKRTISGGYDWEVRVAPMTADTRCFHSADFTTLERLIQESA